MSDSLSMGLRPDAFVQKLAEFTGEPTGENRVEFEKRYHSQTGKVFGRDVISCPCTCDGRPNVHWAAIRNNGDSIRDHVELEQMRRNFRDATA